MNEKRLLKLANMLQATAHKKTGRIKFNMGDWGQVHNKYKPLSCNTLACALGLAALSRKFKNLTYSLTGTQVNIIYHDKNKTIKDNPVGAAATLFDITYDEAELLFTSNTFQEGPQGARYMARVLRHFVKLKKRGVDIDISDVYLDVAAGYKFSRVISAYSIGLNDSMPDDLRQELLLPFVSRLAGTADPAMENERAKFIVFATITRILPICLTFSGLHDLANSCANAPDFPAAMAALDIATTTTTLTLADAAMAASAANLASRYVVAGHYNLAVTEAACVADFAGADRRRLFAIATTILDEAITMGKHDAVVN